MPHLPLVREILETVFIVSFAVGILHVARSHYSEISALRRSATTDNLTDLKNLAAFRQAAPPLMRTAKASSQPVALLTIALDDFGTGHSSLTHLLSMPIDTLKLNRSFVSACLDDPAAATIVQAVATLARHLGKTVVAEGVETAGQLEFVRSAGCDIVQGYHFARALDEEACRAHLEAGGAWSGAAS